MHHLADTDFYTLSKRFAMFSQLWFSKSLPSHCTTCMHMCIVVYMCVLSFLDFTFICIDMKPRIAQLTMLKNTKGEKVEIIKTIAPDWVEVGFLMDLDPTGRTIARIEADNAHKHNAPVVCCREIFTLWLDMPDSTWGNLIRLLIDSEHTDLARQVQDALGL